MSTDEPIMPFDLTDPDVEASGATGPRPNGTTLIPNRPTAEGRAMGEQLARLCDLKEQEMAGKFPGMRPRCGTCAFRAGTVPNGCEPTLMDAVKAVGQFKSFLCHEKPANEEASRMCEGWFIMCSGVDTQPYEVPWDYSFRDEENAT